MQPTIPSHRCVRCRDYTLCVVLSVHPTCRRGTNEIITTRRTHIIIMRPRMATDGNIISVCDYTIILYSINFCSHSTLSFRNSEEFDHGSWRASSRGIPKRNRRETDFTSSDPIIGEPDDDTSDDEPSLSPPSSPPRRPASVMRKRAAAKSIATITTTTTTNDTAPSLAQRSRRETPGCIVNYNSQRQLLIGCAQPNLVEVRPQCNEEGDEGI